MSYTIDSKGEITINGFEKGTSQDQYKGMGKMLGVNLDTLGEVSVGYPLTLNALGTGTLNTPIHKAMAQTSGVATAYYILDSASQVWKSTTYNGTFSFLSTSNTTTGATATNQGLAYWKGYLFKFRNGAIDYLAGGAGTWVTGWNPLAGTTTTGDIITPSVNHFAIVSQDDALYFCNGTGIGSILEVPGQTFNPTNINTYTFAASASLTGPITLSMTAGVNPTDTSATLSAVWAYQTGVFTVTFSSGEQKSVTLTNAANTMTWTGGLASAGTATILVDLGSRNALQLPFYEVAQSMAEQGTNLLIGGSLNAIYPWDRLSTSFAYPLFIGDTFIDRMVTVNTNVYIFPGGQMSRGRIYMTNGSQVNLFYKIPDYITGGGLNSGATIKAEQDPYFTWGDAIYHRNNLIFSFFMKKNGSGYVTADTSFQSTSQLWALNLETNAFRSLSTLTSNTTIGRANVIMPALQTAPGMAIVVGVEDTTGATTANIAYSGTAVGTGRYNIWTDTIPVGTLFQKKTYSQIEFKLRTPLQTSEDISIVPYVDGVFGTAITFNTVGAISGVAPVNFEQAQWLQFLVQSNGASVTSGVRLYEIRIR